MLVLGQRGTGSSTRWRYGGGVLARCNLVELVLDVMNIEGS